MKSEDYLVPPVFDLDVVRERLYAAVLSDVLDQMGCTGQVTSGLSPIADDMKIAGFARTARAVAVNRAPDEPYKHLMAVIDSMTDGDVLVIAADPFTQSAIFGGLLATAVSAVGGRGVVTDGFTRDVHEIRQIGLPTVARGLVPLDSYGRDEVVEIDQRVSVGGVPVSSGDLVFADLDGVVVVPSDICDEVVTRAMEKVVGEDEVRNALRTGMTTAEAFAKYGIL
ncbi:MAG: RraA family protein [Jatrophihabitans sp.]